MAQILELSPHLANLIAAGEVVERPASVAKELVENAIDAGATRIDVEIENGGVSYLRITDNGCGIAAEDAPVAFRRHATSKLRTEADLAAIGTLGFRGEALAAICAVSRMDLLTKQKGAIAGTHLHLDAGKLLDQEEAGCPEGTTFIVRDLFYNTPARMKFLKKDFTEAGYVLSVVHHAAISHPEIAFSMIRDGKKVFVSAGDGKLLTPVFGVFGREMTGDMIEVTQFERDGMYAWGYITKPHAARPNRSMQHFFVNGRYVKNRTMQAALEEAYRNKIITGKYPSCALFLTVPLGAVDVNVHPAKTEIKFSQEKQVFETLYIACKNTLEQDDNIPELKKQAAKPVREDTVTQEQERITLPERSAVAELPPAPGIPTEPPQIPALPKNLTPARKWVSPLVDCEDDFDTGEGTLRQPALAVEITYPEAAATPKSERPSIILPETVPAAKPEEVPAAVQTAAPGEQNPMKLPRAAESLPAQAIPLVIGEAFRTYIVAEEADGSLLLIDKHAAHERMIFNRLRETVEIPQQELLSPLLVELSAQESAILLEHLEEVRTAGFDVAPFGTGSFAVRSAPAYLDSADISAVLSEIAGKLATHRGAVSDTLDDLIHMVACKAAIKAGSRSDMAELQSVCERVMQDPEVTCCPHGRPVAVRLTKYELDKLFKRVNQ